MELTTVPPMTHVNRPVVDHAPRQSRQQAIGMTLQGVRLIGGPLRDAEADTTPSIGVP
jgi:hypothetical protein